MPWHDHFAGAVWARTDTCNRCELPATHWVARRVDGTPAYSQACEFHARDADVVWRSRMVDDGPVAEVRHGE